MPTTKFHQGACAMTETYKQRQLLYSIVNAWWRDDPESSCDGTGEAPTKTDGIKEGWTGIYTYTV